MFEIINRRRPHKTTKLLLDALQRLALDSQKLNVVRKQICISVLRLKEEKAVTYMRTLERPTRDM